MTCVDLVLDKADLAGVVIHIWMDAVCDVCIDLVLDKADLAGVVIHIWMDAVCDVCRFGIG